MLGNKTVVCVIPARLGSSRFPRKMVARLRDKPLLQWAYEGAKRCDCFDEVVVAVDSEELKAVVEEFGGRALMTSFDCQNGTERLVELQSRGALKGDIWVNWQGDEPFISSNTIETLLQSSQNEEEEIWTLKFPIEDPQKIHSPHVVKVVCDAFGKALYFSRSTIPYEGKKVFKHIGLYAYSDRALQKISHLSPSPLEESEKLEQLRFLYHGLSVQVHQTSEEIFGIDTPEHLLLAEELSLML